MILELLGTSVHLHALVQDWRGAVRMSGQILLAAGGIEPAYIDAMERMVDEAGPYIVLTPGLALPHARPGTWVRRACMGVLTLATPVRFGVLYNDPVSIIIPFAATDDVCHLEALSELAWLLLQPEAVNRIKNAQSRVEVVALFGGDRDHLPGPGREEGTREESRDCGRVYAGAGNGAHPEDEPGISAG
jgi:PTS system ascorbate-specific IIA component